MKIRNALLCGLATIIILNHESAWAQAPTQSLPEAGSSSTPVAAEQLPGTADIIVTAQRRNERSVDVPISITSVSAERLTESGVRSTFDLQNIVPNFRVDSNGGWVQPTVRGVGNAIAGAGVNPAVATYIDGYYQASSYSTNQELVGLESVQVLKGPQGTLFGRNATGGAIVLTTRKPSFTPVVEGKLGYARYDEMRGQVYASTGLSDTVAASISAFYRQSDGYYTNIANGDDEVGRLKKWSVHGKLLFQPSDDFSATLGYEHYSDLDNGNVAYSPYNGLTNGQIGIIPPQGYIVPTKRGDVSFNIPTFFRGNLDWGYLTLRYKPSDMIAVTSYTQYQSEKYEFKLDLDMTNADTFGLNTQFPSQTFTQELNISSDDPASKLKWTLGGYYYWNRSENRDVSVIGAGFGVPGGAQLNYLSARLDAKAWALFADATYEAISHLFITVGGRYSKEDQTGYGSLNVVSPRLTGTKKVSFKSFTPRANIRYEINPDANVYASYSKGFKAGGINANDVSGLPTLPTFKPEKVDSYELGAKYAHRGVRVDGAIYYIRYSDQQVASYQGIAVTTLNAAKSEIYGAEFAISADLTSNFNAGVSLAYNHGEYLEYPNAPQDSTIPLPPIDLGGRTMARSPRFTGTFYGNYKIPIGAGRLDLNASLYHTSRFNFDPAGVTSQKAYELLSTRATYTFADDRFSVAAYVNNVTDTKYRSVVWAYAGVGVPQLYGQPRTWGAELGFKF